MRETNVDVVGELTSSRLSSTNSDTLINPGMADVCLEKHTERQKKKPQTEMGGKYAHKTKK